MADNDYSSVIDNPKIECQRRGHLSRIMGYEGADYLTLGRFYLDIIHAILLFGQISWWGDTLNFEGTGGLQSKGGATYCGEAMTSTIQWDMGIPPSGVGHVGDRIGGYGDMYLWAL